MARSSAPDFSGNPMFRGPFAPLRAEIDLVDCEVEGKLPADLDGTFYRVGPDFQYPPRMPNIPFDGEGHVGMFRFANGHVDYKSRFMRTQRYKAQAAAREALFGTYRNPYTDDPRVKGLSAAAPPTPRRVPPRQADGAQGRQPARGPGSGHARDSRRLLHIRRQAHQPHVHGASEDRFRDRRDDRLRLRGARRGQRRCRSDRPSIATASCSTKSGSRCRTPA